MIGNVIQEILCWLVSVKVTHAQYWNDNYVFVIMYVACLVIMISMRDQAPNGHKLLSVYSLLLIGLVLYNPVAHYIGFNLFKDSESIRMWLLLPVVTVIAFAITVVTDNPSLKKAGKGAVIGAMAAVIFFFGSSIMRTQMMVDTTNAMKINDESVKIADVILEDSNNEPTTLLMYTFEDYTSGQFVNGGTVCDGIEQYTADIKVTRLNITPQYWEDNYVSDYNPQGASNYVYVPIAMEVHHHTIDFEYIALPADKNVIGKMEGAGFDLVGTTDSFFVYKANSDWEIIRLDFTEDDGTDLIVLRDRLGHYVFIDTGATQDIEKIEDYIRSTTIEIDAWIVTDNTNNFVIDELLDIGCARIDRIYSAECFDNTTNTFEYGDLFTLYGIGIIVRDDGTYSFYGTVSQYNIVPTEDIDNNATKLLI